jgi:outer membrane protein OmpA-like peptidoglycan-associated protein
MGKALFLFLSFASFCASAQNDTIRIYFDFGVSKLSEPAIRMVDSLLYHQVLEPGRKISVIGYADYVGSDTSNLKLSEARAGAVKQYLLRSGFKPGDIQMVVGRGELQTGNQLEDRKVEIVAGTLQVKKDSGLDLNKLKPNETAQLNNLQFWGGSYELLAESIPTLEALKKFLIDNPIVKIGIEGHVCCVPIKERAETREDFEAIQLSIQRAKTVDDYLVKNGIDRTRLSYKGFGGSRPLVSPASTAQDASRNRRVEIRIIEK